ncbi:MAG: cytochrome c biogenesis protein CcsA [Fuerstiella sp.]
MSTAAIPERQSSDSDLTFGWSGLRDNVLKPMGSLKLTVGLLSVSMFLVFVGSLAQARRDVWMVVQEYFRTWVAWVQIKDLFPPTMFPSMIDYDWEQLGMWKQFPYPGGWLIGTLMCLNLLAAHLHRVRISVKGSRLVSGLVAITVALAVTALVVISGNTQGLQSDPIISFAAVWNMVLGSLGLVAVGGLLLAFGPYAIAGNGRWLGVAVFVISGGILAYYLRGGEEARLSNESMRILWQLILGSIAASALLIASYILFRKRAGIVVLHLGVLMLMYSELQVAMFGRENQMTLTEGETATFLRDIRERELAIVATDGEERQVWVVPEHELRAAAESEAVIDHEILPFRIRVRDFMINSQLKSAADEENPATDGLGTVAVAVEQKPNTGMEETPDISSVYIDILDSDKSVVSTHLVSQEASELRGEFAERVSVKGKTYDLYLRSMRTYRPWSVTLLDVSRTNYIGTATPKDFRSKFRITDENGNEHEYTTWMNNPVRYGGETFYQQGYQNIPGTGEVTTLQVVRNTGWMLPYVGCMVVAFGMFAQFGQTLTRFLGRESGRLKKGVVAETDTTPTSRWLTVGVPALIILSMAGWIAGKAAPRKTPEQAMNLTRFAQTPIAAGGRTQPFDTFAKNSLLSILGKSEFEGEMEPGELDAEREQILKAVSRHWDDKDWSGLEDFNGDYQQWVEKIADISGVKVSQVEPQVRPLMTRKRPAVWWMLDVIARPDVAERHRVFRIVDDQLLALLNLEKRPGFAYSRSEIRTHMADLKDIYTEAHQLLVDDEASRLTPLQRRVHALFDDESRVRFFSDLFNPREIPENQAFATLVETWRLLKILEGQPATLGIPTAADEQGKAWETVVAADAIVKSQNVLSQMKLQKPEQAIAALIEQLPRETLSDTVQLTLKLLRETEKERNPALTDQELAVQIRDRAGRGAQEIGEPYLKRVMELIAASDPEKTGSEIVAELSDEDLNQLTSDRPAPEALSVLEVLDNSRDHRSSELRASLREAAARGADLNEAVNREAVGLVISDLNQRAGHLLFVEDPSETVLARATASVEGILNAWRDGDVAAFNQETQDYHAWLQESDLPFLDIETVRYESFVNRFSPAFYTIFVYLTSLILTFLSWITMRKTLWRSAMGVTVVAFVVHSFYLIARMEISGRPPVTNLYSSAVFIGWVVVLGSFIVEYYSRMGLLNVIGCGAGAATLCMAHFLGIDEGDTLSVMQAVLDTQFWLATHVVCVTVGYAATFLAGLLSIGYCIYWWFGDRSEKHEKGSAATMLGKVIYGTICFALFFSFVGTVLGGLWADDSWGRFWGWDPKENGALLIVIWNALILHARWDKLIRDYGTAVLAVGGNIVTSWSWFGVNELGAGLHKYGFTEGRLMFLAGFMVLNALFMIVAGLVLKQSRKKSDLPSA